jgi:hypothetical protein
MPTSYVFLVTYTTPATDDISYETEWVCPAPWTEQQARSTFEWQHPRAVVSRIQPISV